MEELYKGHGWNIRLEEAKLPDGRVKKVARASRCDGVHILAFPSEKEVIVIREYRPFYKEWIWMLPTGRVDKENDIHVAAQRELMEEAGVRAGELSLYCSVNNSENLVMTNHIFIAKKLTAESLPQDHDELMEAHTLLFDDALEKILTSKRIHTPSAFALLRYKHDFMRLS